jgi:hypothetical protein
VTKINQFKRLRLTVKGLRDLPLTQQRFEELWIKLEKIKCADYEREQCLNKLKEACSWFTRGIAILNIDTSEVLKTGAEN